MHLFVCNLNAYGCFEPHTESENVVNKISVIFSFESWQVWVLQLLYASFTEGGCLSSCSPGFAFPINMQLVSTHPVLLAFLHCRHTPFSVKIHFGYCTDNDIPGDFVK